MKQNALKFFVIMLLLGMVVFLSANSVFTAKSFDSHKVRDGERGIPYPPEFLQAERVNNEYAHLTWGEPVEWVETLLRQHDNNPVDSYYQLNFAGYGSVFDISNIRGTYLERVEFRHSSWGLNGVWPYKIHVIDWETGVFLKEYGPFNTTVNDNWERNISLESLPTDTDFIGIFMQPLGNEADDAYPCLDMDAALNGFSAIVNLGDLSDGVVAGGDFLIDLYVLAPPQSGEALAKKVEFDISKIGFTENANFELRSGKATVASNSNVAVQTTEVRSSRALISYNLYRYAEEDKDNPELWTDLQKVEDLEVLEYEDNDWDELVDGFYGFAITANYDTDGTSNPTHSNILFKGELSLVTIEVTTNSGDEPTGTVVTLKGAANYSKTTSSTGMAIIPDVMPGIYEISASLDGFEYYKEENVEIDGAVFEKSIELVELLLPVDDLKFEVVDQNNVVLSWQEPGSIKGVPQWFHWSGEYTGNGVGTGGAAKFKIASRFTSEQLRDLDVIGLEVKKMVFAPNVPNATYILKIWEGGGDNPLDPGTEVLSQKVVNFEAGALNEVELDHPVTIKDGIELWLGVDIDTQTGHPAGCDDGPAYNKFGNLMFFDNKWQTLIEIAGTLNYNWMLRGYAGHPERGMIALGDERAVLNYTVKRNGVVIADEVTETTYTDVEVPNGAYIYTVIANYTAGESTPVHTSRITINATNVETITIPGVTRLNGNYPNPFNPETSISFELKSEESVLIEIYNMRGQKVRTLVNNRLSAGSHSLEWNGKDDNSQEVGSGIYFYKMVAGDYSSTKKMIMMK
ncbi:MAG: T9SS type A sorting domain-containing protein [Candidatus Cloacimonas sp.]|nr:T9SS type A sorting domain-containing protein [Candidatus Cloacimonadota bacterium]